MKKVMILTLIGLAGCNEPLKTPSGKVTASCSITQKVELQSISDAKFRITTEVWCGTPDKAISLEYMEWLDCPQCDIATAKVAEYNKAKPIQHKADSVAKTSCFAEMLKIN